MAELYPSVASTIQQNLERSRATTGHDKPASFISGDLVFVGYEDFHTGEKLCQLWRGARRIVRAINDSVHIFEDLWNVQLTAAHQSSIKLCNDASIYETSLLCRFI